ncbi:MAG: hypothetical protein ACREOD_03655 [Candidatus Dormibacteria bacterium]
MWSSLVRRPLIRALSGAATLAAGGALLSACIGPAVPATHALNNWLADVRAHSVAYAYTLLSSQAEMRTDYDQFFDGVNHTRASYRILATRTVSSTEVTAVVEVSNGSSAPTRVRVQMIEEGNAGDWLVGEPFTGQGARAIRYFK